jgi:hypothetical protein
MMARVKSYFEKCFSGLCSAIENELSEELYKNGENPEGYKSIRKNFKGINRRKI